MMFDTLRERAGKEEYDAGQALYQNGLVREISRDAAGADYMVSGTPNRAVHMSCGGRVHCDCDLNGPCRHAVAALLCARDTGTIHHFQERRARDAAPELLAAMESALPEAGGLRMAAELRLSEGMLRVGLRVGEERLYVVRNLPEFFQCMKTGGTVSFGKGFVYHAGWMRFDDQQLELIHVLEETCETLSAANVPPDAAQSRLLPLSPSAAKRVWRAVSRLPFKLTVDGKESTQQGIAEETLPLRFHLSGRAKNGQAAVGKKPPVGAYTLTVTAESDASLTQLTPDCAYVLQGDRVVSVPSEQRAAVRVFLKRSSGGRAAFTFEPGQSKRVMCELLPFLMRAGDLSVSPELEGSVVRLPLRKQVFLDRDGADVTARAEFLYGEYRIDPFAPDTDDSVPLLLRDAAGERTVTDELAKAGFRVFRGRVYLTGQDVVYAFVTEGVSRLTACAEVFLSNDFKKLSPRRPRFTGELRAGGAGLTLSVDDDGTPVEELMPLMRALRDNRKYFRYRSGAFISLHDLDSWQPLARALCEAEETGDARDFGAFRAAYLDALIRAGNLPITLNEGAKNASALICEAPPAPFEGLRPYQERGFAWLCALHMLHMGGVLADDMGLGKTIQAIAAVLHFRRNAAQRKPSIVVAPTSLTYNWLSEFKRFAPELNAVIVSGSQSVRAVQLNGLMAEAAPDVLITSYPLIRRDIALLRGVNFRFAILDEAQHIKNAASVGAHAVKQLCADTRVALTGTPMENHAGELWSLFDFILPGYLPRAGAFMHRYGDGQEADDLVRRIRPFLMRRLKKDVLSELPEKLEETLMADMPLEQRHVYQAALLQKREHVREILDTRGMNRGRAEVLSAITELRQICCHPSLCLPEYEGASGKLEMLCDVLTPALAAGRRALVFSQFTRMLRLIEKRLAIEGIPCLYLDGDTPADERMQLCDSFNAGTGSVFLLSLKAGGVGLNLTGADMVIHYDPWWNPAAEEQAVDRAHRIGQTHIVEVVRLLMHDSIEEQVVSMSRRKRQLFDKLITPGESMPTRLSDADILSLFGN